MGINLIKFNSIETQTLNQFLEEAAINVLNTREVDDSSVEEFMSHY